MSASDGFNDPEAIEEELRRPGEQVAKGIRRGLLARYGDTGLLEYPTKLAVLLPD